MDPSAEDVVLSPHARTSQILLSLPMTNRLTGRFVLQPFRPSQVNSALPKSLCMRCSFVSIPESAFCSHPAVPLLIEASEKFRDKLEFFSGGALLPARSSHAHYLSS